MDSKQLMDSLADHVALYHSSSASASASPAPKSQLRSNILRWMSTLSTEQRQAALTIVDDSWVAIILQMHARIQKHGPGFFILLPDVPVNNKMKPQHGAVVDVVLPSMCYRKAKGLLARVNSDNQADRTLTDSLRLFSSMEGRLLLPESPPLDSLLVAEDLTKDADRFVCVMDAISNGEFLRTKGPPFSASRWNWEELPWLKAKGYYSLAAFVANKLELSLRLSWLNSRAKKRNKNSNSSTSNNCFSAGNAHETAKNGGVALGVFWGKKGCVDWWSKVDGDIKATAFKLAVTKAVKFEVNQLVRNAKGFLQTEMQGNRAGNKAIFAGEPASLCKVSSIPKVSCLDSDFKRHSFPSNVCGKHSCSCNFLSALYILQEVSSLAITCTSRVPEDDRLFFSSLSSADTVLDNIMRRVREVFAKVSKDSLELDLLSEVNTRSHLNQLKAKDAEVQKREKRRKGRSKKKKAPLSKQNLQDASPEQLLEDGCAKPMPCEKQLKLMKPDVDSRKGNIRSLTDPGMTKIRIKKESFHNLICQGENKMSPCRLQKTLESEWSVSGMGESQVKSNTQVRGRSKIKKKGTANMDAALLSNDKERTLGDYCGKPQQQAVKIQHSTSLNNAKCDELIDCSGKHLCSQNIHFASSFLSSTNLCAVENGRACSAEQSITHSDKMGSDVPLSNTDLRVNHESNCGTASETEILIPVSNSHVACESDESGICERETQMDSSPKSNIPDRVKEDANFISRDCKSSSGFVSLLEKISHNGRRKLSYPLHHEKEREHEHLQCSIKPDTTCFQICSNDSLDLIGALVTPGAEPQHQQRSRNEDYSIQGTASVIPHKSYEWPGSLHFCFPSTTHHLPAATERLHLDVDSEWRCHSQPSFVALRRPMVRNSSGQGGYHKRNTKPQAAINGSDSSPPVQTGCNIKSSIGYSLESGFTRSLQPSLQVRCVPASMELNGIAIRREDSKYEGADYSTCDTDDFESYVISEDETEKVSPENAFIGSDYNHVFGGGVMYWNTADYAATGYSRPTSLSSEDSSWARHEDDLKLVIEDIVNLTSLPGPYGNGGVASPPTKFYSAFDSSCSGTLTTPVTFGPSAGSIPASEEQDSRSTVKCTVSVMDGIHGEALPHPILRPIVIPNMSKQRTTNDLHLLDSRSPCVPCKRREPIRLKRPPSPVVLCVPPAPPPPPPSPVGDFRKQRRFPNVRSGSSSPRNWRISGWPNEAEIIPDDFRLSAGNPEVASFAWRRKCIPATSPMHSLTGALLHDRLVAIPQLALEQEHPDIALPLQSAAIQNNPALQASVTKLRNLLHDEIEYFCKQVASENLMRKPFINAALERVSRALQVLWPRSRTKIFGSIATGLALPTSDVDLVVCLPPVRNLEPIKEAGILEGRNGIKETCLQHATRYLADQEWVKNDSLKTIENTAIPIIMLVVNGLSQNCSKNEYQLSSRSIRNKAEEEKEEGTVPNTSKPENFTHSVRSDATSCETKKTPSCSKDNRESVRLDISFESPSHTGLKTAGLVRELIGRFPAIVPLALVLKQFLTDRSLDHPYSGGLSSYCLVLLITRFLQHEHHAGRAINQNLGSLLMDFLYFFGCVFDPRQMRVSIYGNGMYVKRDRGQSIDPLHIDDPIDIPLHQANNVGRNCFRIHQCIKAFADAHSILEKELLHLANVTDSSEEESGKYLSKIIPSIAGMYKDRI